MKKLIAIVFFLGLFLFSFPKKVFAQTIDCDSGFQPLYTGITYKTQDINYAGRSISWHIVKADLNSPGMDIEVTPREGLGNTTTDFLSNFGADVAINGDYHDTLTHPLGLAAAAGDIYAEDSAEPSMLISQTNVVTFTWGQPGNIWDAISGSNWIVQNGHLGQNYINCTDPQYCTTTRSRTGVGLSDNNELLLIVEDNDGSNGITERELAQQFVSCGAQDAINMDGGSSTTLASRNAPAGLLAGTNAIVANHLGICSQGCPTVYPPVSNLPIPDGEPRPRYLLGNLYPFPCNRIAPENSYPFLPLQIPDNEFHSLRPYQASPCNNSLQQIAISCGNNLVVGVDATITMSYGDLVPLPPLCSTPWNDPNTTNCCDPGTYETDPLADGLVRCRMRVSGTTPIAVDVSGAELPIMGYTEPSVGHEGDPDPQVTNRYNIGREDSFDNPLIDTQKTNEYVSWYLNGVIGRAEYPPLDVTRPDDGTTSMENPSDIEKIINFSGPIKKLLPLSTQNRIRINQITDAISSRGGAGIRHDEVAGCTKIIGTVRVVIPFTNITITLPSLDVPASCATSLLGNFFSRQLHLSSWTAARRPPLEENYSNSSFENFLLDYHTWRGQFCVPVVIAFPVFGTRTINFCFDNPFSPNFWSTLFPNIPFSSTEDRLGSVEIASSSIQPPMSNDFRIITATITGQTPAWLYFAHMEEDNDLAKILQQTYAGKNLDLLEQIDSAYVTENPFCDIREVRTNPGDQLFAGEITATLNYVADIEAWFFDGTGSGRDWCTSLGGECHELTSTDPGDAWDCDTYYPNLDCPEHPQPGHLAEFCGRNCHDATPCISARSSTPCDTVNGPIFGHCCPNARCGQISPIDGNALCVSDPIDIATPPPQSHTVTIFVNLNLITKTPLVENIWRRLVAGSQSVVMRFFPKLGTNSVIERFWDMPTSTHVSYSSTDPNVTILAGNPGNGRPGDQAELYFPHIGGIKEYFLTGIQTLLRPKGYGNQIVSGPAEGGPPWSTTPPGGGTGPTACGTNLITVPGAQSPYPPTGYSWNCNNPATVGWCSPATLAANGMTAANGFTSQDRIRMSVICMHESGGWTNALNDGCLCNLTLDFSVGLFQINLLPDRCQPVGFPDPFTDWGSSPTPHCVVGDTTALQQCSDYYFDPVHNIEKAISASRSFGAFPHRCYDPWLTIALNCGFPLCYH